MNVFSSSNFASMPRNLEKAKNAGWTLIDEQCSDASKPFRGFRYWLKEDPAVILIFDKNGFIAGIQTAIDSNQNRYEPGPYRTNHPFIKFNNMQTLTAYFVDPGKKLSEIFVAIFFLILISKIFI